MQSKIKDERLQDVIEITAAQNCVYATMPISKIDINKEISRWQNVIEFNKEGTDNYLENKERSLSLIRVAKVNLEYLISLPNKIK